MATDRKTLNAGESMDIPVERAPGFAYVSADLCAVSGPALGSDIELSFLAIANRYTRQAFTVDEEQPGGGGTVVSSGAIYGDPVLVEQVNIRMTPEAMFSAAVVILRHISSKNLIAAADLKARLMNEPFLS